MSNHFSQSPGWLKKAIDLRPKLYETIVLPSSLCTIVRDEAAFSGWKAVATDNLGELESRIWKWGESFILDFGNHHVGRLQFDFAARGEVDAPARLRLVFAELPLELGEPFDPFTGSLSRSWLQDEILTCDILPGTGEFVHVDLPRRYAFRYVRVELTSLANYELQFRHFRCRGLTSADETQVSPVKLGSPWKEIEEVSRRTLRNCMQEVFEDGPKRDRRLWMGDLRLQALANAVTFKNFSLVKRCLYLFAALTTADGMVNGCVYEYPSPHGSKANPIDYALLFGPTLLEYIAASGDEDAARDLWPVALRQLDFGWGDVDEEGVWHNSSKRWVFIDWNPDLNKKTCLAGVLAFSIQQTMLLARALDQDHEMTKWRQRLQKLAVGTRKAFWDEKRGVAVCDGQISWLSQAWLILGGILLSEEGAGALRLVLKNPQSIRPISPYGCHTVVEAMLHCGLKEEAAKLVHEFWGGMINLGADTFWEVWNPSDHRTSPYGNPLLNSACHAWSCTPTYFIRRWPELTALSFPP
jgi:hypothetical protein